MRIVHKEVCGQTVSEVEGMKKIRNLNLYQKFALVIICVGLIPMGFLSTVMMDRMLKEYGSSLKANYQQAVSYVALSLDNMLESYNDVSKMPYYYNYSSEGIFELNYMSFDNLRKILYGEGSKGETAEGRNREMTAFLRNVQSVDSSIAACHFLADNSHLEESFHYSTRNTFLRNEELFRQRIRWDELDRSGKKLILIPSHEADYYNQSAGTVFTIGRNYFDLTKVVSATDYIGTLYIDIDIGQIDSICRHMDLGENAFIYIVDREGNCFYASSSDRAGKHLPDCSKALEESKSQWVVESSYSSYGLKAVAVIPKADAFGRIWSMQAMIYGVLGISLAVLLYGSLWFSKRLTQPVRNMMEQMSAIESGNFKARLPVISNDEIGILSRRFNEMSQELETYINKSYVAQLKQNEAEMTALKSQIYPHFLYNTLEIIRMEALELEEGDRRVSRMIEALSRQIHYMIGPMKDMVPLKMEADMVEKYVYLLNCRTDGKIQLSVNLDGMSGRMVPKLILQPIVENAYVHGIKPMSGSGNIMIDAEAEQGVFVIALLDNGVGMDEQALSRLQKFLDSDEIGIKSDHSWQRIGLKNVHDRIRYLYGEEYGLEITSTPGVGTMVRVVMPDLETEEEGQNDTDASGG